MGNPNPLRTRQCRACFTTFTTRDSRKVYCGGPCAKAFSVVVRVRYPRCEVCGRSFTVHGNSWKRNTCSEDCRLELRRIQNRLEWERNYERAKRVARKHTALRRARLKGVAVEDFTHEQVFHRDHWTCHLCGLSINPRLRRPHPGAASLDHIVPLSLGGPHTLDNVAASHAWCNQSKHNRPAREQLRLIG